MKSYLLILISAIFLISFSGCKKKSFDPTGKTIEDFIGTWKGNISTFKNNQLLKEYGTMVIYPDAGGKLLSGILFMKETSVFHSFQFVKGTLYFKVVNNDPVNVMCQNWSLGGYAVFSDEGKIDIRITGNECGQLGDEFINWLGTMASVQVPADSVKYFNFAKTGNSWSYKVTLKNGDSCQVQKLVNNVTASYQFSGATTQTCGWAGQNRSFNWIVSPSEFSVVNDSTLSEKPCTFPINAKPGVVYNSYVNSDTLTVTLLDTTAVITTPAGSYSCFRFRYTGPVHTCTVKYTRTAYLWLNNRYGVVRQEVLNPPDSTDVHIQELSSKNF